LIALAFGFIAQRARFCTMFGAWVAEASQARSISPWISALDRVIALKPRVVGSDGTYSTNALTDLAQTRDYLVCLRSQISAAFEQGLGCDAAYRQIGWSQFAALPAFEAANRRNAYQAYMNVERDALKAARP
jgi:hypothetical protein